VAGAEAAAAAPSEDSECCALVVLLLLLLLVMVPKKVEGVVAAVFQGRPDLLLAAFASLLVSAAAFGAQLSRLLRQGYPGLQDKVEGTDERGQSMDNKNKATHAVRVFRREGAGPSIRSQDGPTEVRRQWNGQP
jgi:hypothetical protein